MANRYKILHSGMSVVSSSAQIDYTQIQNKPTSIESASFAATAAYALNVPLTASHATIADTASYYNLPNGVVSSSAQAANWSVATASYVANAISSSYATSAGTSINANTASYVTFANVSGKPSLVSSSLQFTPFDNVTFGQLTASGINVQTLHAQTITSSVEYSSGSNKFGSISTDTHQFTGSVSVSGSFAVSGVGSGILTATGAPRTITGTADQVIVTNGDGVAGNPTLALPQSIATTSAPRFARVGLGAAADGTSLLNLNGALIHGTPTGVGIGTTAPAGELDVLGSVFSRGTSPLVFFFRGLAGGSGSAGDAMGAVGFGVDTTLSTYGSATGARICGELDVVDGSYRPKGRIRISTSNGTDLVERMRINSSGNIGIGTPAPNARLSFGANPNQTFALFENAGGSNLFGYKFTSGTGVDRISTITNGGEAMSVTNAGHVGIGTTSPGRLLHLLSGEPFLKIESNGLSNGVHIELTPTPGYNASVGSTNACPLVLRTADADRVIIGTTGVVRFNAYGAGTLVTDSSGNVTATSDARMKNISGSFDRGLDAIVNLSPKVYRWNEASGLNTDDVNVGLIAQEVLPYIPEAVSEKDGRYTMSDRPIIAALINAVKELAQKNADLEARIAALEL